MRVSVASAIASASAIIDAANGSSPPKAAHRALDFAQISGGTASAPVVAGELHLPADDRAPAVVVPQHEGGYCGQPTPPEPSPRRDPVAGKGAHRRRQCRCCCGPSLGDQKRETVQQQIGRTRRIRPSGGRARRPARRPRRWRRRRDGPRTTRRPTPPDRSREPARGPAARAAWPPSAAATQRRCRSSWRMRPARAAGRPGRAEARPARRPRGRQQPERRIERSGLQADLCRGERALGPLGRLRGQLDRALQERGGGGQPAARLRPARRALELRRRPPHPGPVPPRRDARPAGPDRPPDRSPPPTPDAPPDARQATPTGTPPSAPADGETSPAHRSRAARPPPGPPRPPGRSRAVQPRATATADRRSAPPPPTSNSAARPPEARRVVATKLSSIRPVSA